MHKPILLRPHGRRQRRRAVGASKMSGTVVVLALALVNYFLFFNDADNGTPPPMKERLERPAGKALGTDKARKDRRNDQNKVSPGDSTPEPQRATPEEVDDFGEPIGRRVAGALKRGMTLIKALQIEGIDTRTALPVIRAMQKVFDFRSARVGNTFQAWLDDEGQLRRLTYHHSRLDVYEVVLLEDGSYNAVKKVIPTRVEVASVGCAIRSSLYESVKRCGEGNSLGGKVIDLFAWDVDFFQDIRKGDEFRVIVEKISVNGKFLKYGRVLAAEYFGKFGRHRIVHYKDTDGHEGYYTPAGRAVRKDFLKSPLKYTMVSAGRRSGVQGSLKKASSVVYTAKSGTPVWAVASGTIVHAGRSGELGLAVTIKHDNGFTSTYGHLAKLGRGLKVGRLVNQKTVIGKVGRTGKTRASQLYFSLKKRGRIVNPLKMDATEADPIPDGQRPHFREQVQQLLETLEATPIIGVGEKRS